ncbi:hypothetical protein MMH89_00310 [Candidatus Comchoanobacter bicostacola]|uniref:Uncharacterized protein n=1 Tax=Candidatus Comchoanobacter bicostacola TaxID=2919598 RepID=A0ABY5DKU9_9GAMM|nr:hypothetical protein [Candidatus Comchoanobacter bicostacola]UTC24608.1 hypothetical protein MMH89_00310 [Candidatus Comchoanobacter bicostacola]
MKKAMTLYEIREAVTQAGKTLKESNEYPKVIFTAELYTGLAVVLNSGETLDKDERFLTESEVGTLTSKHINAIQQGLLTGITVADYNSHPNITTKYLALDEAAGELKVSPGINESLAHAAVCTIDPNNELQVKHLTELLTTINTDFNNATQSTSFKELSDEMLTQIKKDPVDSKKYRTLQDQVNNLNEGNPLKQMFESQILPAMKAKVYLNYKGYSGKIGFFQTLYMRVKSLFGGKAYARRLAALNILQHPEKSDTILKSDKLYGKDHRKPAKEGSFRDLFPRPRP